MQTAVPHIAQLPTYNESLRGVYGEFGSGNNLQAIYLQTAITPKYLDKISLISDVQGSERWRVRDLFQREVDDERITNSLLPYLESRNKIKFFNPLTLTVLPIDERSGTVLSRMPRVAERTIEEDGHKWTVREREGYYRLRWLADRRIKSRRDYAQLDWNSDRSQIVAVDGQHRLAALKRMQRHWRRKDHSATGGHLEEPVGVQTTVRDSFLDWRVPVVIVTFRATTGQSEPPSVLDVVRSIFVYINTKAHRVGEAREILLNDESVNTLAAQELLERSHSNDLKPREERREDRVPLLFFDWRGQERDRKAVPVPAAVKTIGEIRSWFQEYVLGDDFSQGQEMALDVRLGGRLKSAFKAAKLDYATSRLVRDRLRESVVPAVSYVLENFRPYREYIAGLRRLEERSECGNDLQHDAFDRLRFGRGQEFVSNKELEDVEQALCADVEKLKRAYFQSPIDQDVGMRGVMQAFGGLISAFGYRPDWMEYAKWFTDVLNFVYADGWFEPGHEKKGGEHLRHVVWDQNDEIVNYRLRHARNALGAYVALLIGSKAPPPAEWCPEWPTVRAVLLGRLEGTVVGGYKKEIHPVLKEQYPNGGRELELAKKEEAEKLARRQMRRFERALEQFACPEAEKAASGGD